MNTPEGNKRGGITVRRKLANGLSIVALGVSSAMGVGGCSGIKEGRTYPQETQTQSAQGELTEQNTIMIPSRPTEGDYTLEQMERIQSGEFSDQENALENWARYWGAAENGPFRPETKDLRYKYLFDGEGNCFVLLEASGEGYEGRLFALPIRDGLFMEAPPEIPNEGFDIPEGFGPLMLTGSVAYRDGGLVRLDDDGGVSERLNLETARWEEPKIWVETDSSNPETFPTVTLDDFESGEILAAEREYLETHNPFTGNEIWPEKFKIFYGYDKAFQFISFDFNNVPAMEGYRNNPATIPARTMFYYQVDLPDGYFPVPEDIRKAPDYNQFNYFLVGEVWLNPDWSEGDPASDRYRILHYLFEDPRPWYEPVPSDPIATYLPLPIYSLGDILYDDNYESGAIEYVWKYIYANQYGDEFPKNYIEEWAETGRVPAELENYVLACKSESFN